jgi:hypothetical protein
MVENLKAAMLNGKNPHPKMPTLGAKERTSESTSTFTLHSLFTTPKLETKKKRKSETREERLIGSSALDPQNT